MQGQGNPEVTKCPVWSLPHVVGETLLSHTASLAKYLLRSSWRNGRCHRFVQCAHKFSVTCLSWTLFPHSPLPTPKVTAADCRVGRIFQAVLAQAVNKLGAQKCDGKAFPPGVHRPSRTFMSHYSPYSSLCPNKSERLCRDGLDRNESFCWHFPFTEVNNGAKPPHLATLLRENSQQELFAQAWQRSLQT